jgi:hypothetical protein
MEIHMIMISIVAGALTMLFGVSVGYKLGVQVGKCAGYTEGYHDAYKSKERNM